MEQERQWYYRKNGQDRGPIGETALRELAAVGVLGRDDFVWPDGYPKPQPAFAFSWLFPNTMQEQSTGAQASTHTDGPHRDAPSKPIPATRRAVASTRRRASASVPRSRKWQRPLILRDMAGCLTVLLIGIVIGSLVTYKVMQFAKGVGSTKPRVGSLASEKPWSYRNKSERLQAALSRPLTVFEADENFRVAASYKGEDGLYIARILIDLRTDEYFSWERLEDEVLYQMEDLRPEFERWKEERIRAGDRYK